MTEDLPAVAEPSSDHHALRRMFRRDTVYTLGFVLQLGMGAIVTPVLTRVLGAESYGRVAACIAVMQVLFTLEGLGLTTGILRIATLEGIRAGRAVLGLSLVASTASSAVLLGTYQLWAAPLGFGAAREALLLTIVWSGLSACTAVSLALLRSADRLAAVLVVDAVQIGGALALGLILAEYSHDTVDAYLWGMTIAQVVSLAIALVWLPPVLAWWRGRPVLWRALVFSLPVLPQLLSNFVLSTSDRLVLGRYLGPVAVGRYQIAYGLACVALLMVGVLSSQWLPSLLAIGGAPGRRRAVTAARDQLAGMLLPTVLGLCLGLPELLRVWVSARYDPTGLTGIVVLVAVSTVPFTLYVCHSLVLFIDGSTRMITVVNVIAAALNLGLNLLLVPRIGLAGAAWSTLAAYVVLWLMAARATRGSPVRPAPRRRVAAAVLATCALAGASAWVPVAGVWGPVRCLGCAACLAALSLAARRAGRPDRLLAADAAVG